MSNYSLIAWFHRSNRSVATIASMVTVCFGMMILAPTVAAANDAMEDADNEALIAGSEERQLSNAVAKVKRTLERLQGKIDKNEDGTLEKNELKQLENTVRQLDQTVSQRFDQIAQHIQTKNLDPVIQQRHTDMVSTYRTEFDALVDYLTNLESTDAAVVSQAVQDALTQLSQFMLKRPHQPIVPGQFSNFTVEPDLDNQPKETEDAFAQAGYSSSPQYVTSLAAAGDFTYSRLAGASDPAYLAESDEVRITDAIRDKALELENDPVKIYYWVRNNVEWLPTWGAIQDADITLGSQRGNSIDIASLLIALYRASGIPSRYVHGAVEVPVDQFNNWAGNFTETQAALSFASSGGIPLRQFTLTDGTTTTTTVRMEHVWVEAALDYFPSRAAVNKDADSWVKLDASFKQYEKLEGLDPIAISGINPELLAQQLIDSGTVSETEGWVQGFDPTIIQTAQTQMQTSLESYIENQLQNPTVGDVVGGRRTIIQEYPTVPSNAEVKILAAGARYAQIPGQLAPTITFAFSTDVLGYPNDPTTYRWSKLNNRKVTLSFRPATLADEDALNSLIPTDVNGPEDLPTSVPSYLIQVVAELKIEGLTAKTSGPLRLGEEMLFYNRIDEPNRAPFVDQRSIIVGSYVSFAVMGGSVSETRLTQLQAQVNVTRNTLETDDTQLIANLSREDLLGDVFYAGILGYFTQYRTLSSLMIRAQNGQFGLPLSAGVYSYEPNVSYFFGIPRAIEGGWASMDLHRIARLAVIPGQSSAQNAQSNFRLGGLSSALEHVIPEQMFVTEDSPGEAVSAIKALSLASAQGQRVYNINSDNISIILPELALSPQVKQEISAYVNAGFSAVTHQNEITVPGWRGAGYVLYDESTGAASWKISGGSNGSFFAIVLLTALIVLITVFAVQVLAVVLGGGVLAAILPFIGGAAALANFLDFIKDLKTIDNPGDLNVEIFVGFLKLLVALAVFLPIAEAILATNILALRIFAGWFIGMMDYFF